MYREIPGISTRPNMFIEGKRHPNDFFSPSETKHQDLTLAMALDLLNVLPSDLYQSLSPFREGMIAALNGGGSFSQRCLREDSLQVSLQSFLELLCLLLASQFRREEFCISQKAQSDFACLAASNPERHAGISELGFHL